MHSFSRSGLCLGLLLVPGLLAQAPRAVATKQQPISEAAALAAAARAYGIVAEGGKVIGLAGNLNLTFGAASTTITPLLGPDAAHSMPLTLTPTQVRRGNQVVQIIAQHQEQQRGDDFIDFDLGRGVTERYVTRADGIKHSYFFDSRPAGTGDLAVRIAIDTLLQCDANEHAQQLQFAAGNLGSVHIGAVVGIDQTGQRADGYMRFDGQHLDLVLPAAFVDSATYPLELDPIISGAINAGRSFSDTNPDIAYDTSNAVYLVVYESVASATDQDVWAQRITYDGIRLANPILIDSNSYRSTRPQVGNCNSLNNFLVAWQENGTTGNWNIQCRSVDAATGSTSSIGQVATTSADEVDCDVGGDSYDNSPGTGLCLCVWDDTVLGIQSCVVRMQNDPPTADSYQTVFSGADPFRNQPAITKDGRDTGRWFIAYQHDANFLSVTAVDYAGTVLTPGFGFYSPNNQVSRPDIDGDADTFKVVYERTETSTSINKDIWAISGGWSGGALQLTQNGPLAATVGIFETEPAISLMGSKYTAAWVSGFDIHVTNLELDSIQTCGTEHVVSVTNRTFHAPALVSRRSAGDSTSESGLLAYQPYDTMTGSNGLDARMYATFGNNPIVPIAGAGGCGGGGTIGTSGGNFALGNHDFKVTLSGSLPTAAFGLFLANVSGGPVNGLCGPTCGYITPDITFGAPIVAGDAEFAIDLPCQPIFLGFQLGAQWAVFDLLPTGCVILPTVHFSNAIRMTLGD